MDAASLAGIILGISLIVGAIFIDGQLDNFFNLPGFMIVFGGTIAATLITFQLKDVVSAFKAAFFVFSEKQQDPNDMVETMIELCTISRRQGLIALSRMNIEDDLLRKACNLIADGSKEDLIRDTLHIEIESMKQRHFIVQDVFRKMAIYAPFFWDDGNPDRAGANVASALQSRNHRAGHGGGATDHFLWNVVSDPVFSSYRRKAERSDAGRSDQSLRSYLREPYPFLKITIRFSFTKNCRLIFPRRSEDHAAPSS